MANHNCRKYEFDVALSFAGEDRKYVEKVASFLQKGGLRVFYDKYEKANLWGKDLYQHLDKVYQQTSKYVVIFVSKHYAKKLWTSHELKSAQARAFSENEEYVLPAMFDDTEIPGIRKTIGYVNANEHTPSELAKLVITKLSSLKLENVLPSNATRVKQMLKIYNWEIDEEDVDFVCHHIFSILKLLSQKEKSLLNQIILQGCGHNLPADVYIELSILERHTSMSEDEILATLNGMTGLGFEYEIETIKRGTKKKGNQHTGKVLSLILTPLNTSIEYENIILFLYYMLYSAIYGQCTDCATDSLIRLDFSGLDEKFSEEEIKELTPFEDD